MTGPLDLLFPPSDIAEVTDTLVPLPGPDVHTLTVLPSLKACHCTCGMSAKMKSATALWAVIVDHCIDATEMSARVHYAVRELFARVLALVTARIGPYDIRVSYFAELTNSWAHDISHGRRAREADVLVRDGVVIRPRLTRGAP